MSNNISIHVTAHHTCYSLIIHTPKHRYVIIEIYYQSCG